MRKLLLGGLLACLVWTVPARAAEPSPKTTTSRAYVVLVGVSDYADKAIKPRKHAEDDAKALYDLFGRSLISGVRVRDPKRGWFVYRWKAQRDQTDGFIQTQKKKILGRLKQRSDDRDRRPSDRQCRKHEEGPEADVRHEWWQTAASTLLRRRRRIRSVHAVHRTGRS